MKNEIKEILDYFRYIVNDKKETYTVVSKDIIYLEHLLDYITNLQEELEYVRKQNNDLRKIYRNTYKRYQEQGNDEMAGYFMAQIDECRTFYVEPVVDYYMLSKELQEENKRLKSDLECYENGVYFSSENDKLQEENERLRKDYGRLMQDNAYTLELEQRIDKALDYIEIIDNRNSYIDISELRHVYEILKGE